MFSASLYFLFTLFLFLRLNFNVVGMDLDRNGCGKTKGCLFRPNGCNPMLDCAIAIVFTISGKNQLYIQMAAQSIYPPPPLQYIAIGFSHDKLMGNDFVSECVLNTDGSLFNDVEVYASYNLEKSRNDRTLLNSTEHSLLYGNVEGKMEDGRLYCSFTQAIRPQFSLSSSRSNLIWNLDKPFWIMGATGGAQPDEINSHDTARGSHFYPILSSKVIDISTTSSKHYDLPIQYQENETKKFNKVNGTTTPINSAFKRLIGGGLLIISFIPLIVTKILFLRI
ncbi:unnamed protein product [Meloidogyne enterolobii]|uniref:Uncharacterized protein n=1 Tax=Meloidogyne enterolobii TaxID=390850 RepID=A0ACB1A1Z6_MELEN